jgi:hypothetical protein
MDLKPMSWNMWGENKMFVYRFKFRDVQDLKIKTVMKVLASNESQALFFIKRKLGEINWYPSSDKRSFITPF